MKAGDEVKAGHMAWETYVRNRSFLTWLQWEWLDAKSKREGLVPWGVMQKHGVPSDAELQRREGS